MCVTLTNKKANAILSCIKRSLICKTQEVMITLYLAPVKPQLEKCVQFYTLHFKKAMEKLERIQSK